MPVEEHEGSEMNHQKKIRTVIMGAAGRDFHNFNSYFRDNPAYEVLAFTATQIPNIEGRQYPADLAGDLYPDGIPILAEEELTDFIREEDVDLVVFSYSDVSHEYVMHCASIIAVAGANFMLMGCKATMLKSKKPVVSVCAVRTGCGKSQTTRRVAAILRAAGKRVVVVRHPMPYGDLSRQAVQRFGSVEDLEAQKCTIEEREEYEPHIENGTVVFAGVDYRRILAAAEAEADVILWDGGNNDLPFFRPDVQITVTDPHRPGHELMYYPGESNLQMADIVIINKVDTADYEDVVMVSENVREANPGARIIEASSPILLDEPGLVRGKRVLVVEDGPTLTHGEMEYGAGVIAARRYGAEEIVDPRPFLAGTLKETFEKYPDIGCLIPAMGYGAQQVADLSETINNADCDLVIIATPVDLARIMDIRHPHIRIRYELQEIGRPNLEDLLGEMLP
jgi:predicted GTPase